MSVNDYFKHIAIGGVDLSGSSYYTDANIKSKKDSLTVLQIEGKIFLNRPGTNDHRDGLFYSAANRYINDCIILRNKGLIEVPYDKGIYQLYNTNHLAVAPQLPFDLNDFKETRAAYRYDINSKYNMIDSETSDTLFAAVNDVYTDIIYKQYLGWEESAIDFWSKQIYILPLHKSLKANLYLFEIVQARGEFGWQETFYVVALIDNKKLSSIWSEVLNPKRSIMRLNKDLLLEIISDRQSMPASEKYTAEDKLIAHIERVQFDKNGGFKLLDSTTRTISEYEIDRTDFGLKPQIWNRTIVGLSNLTDTIQSTTTPYRFLMAGEERQSITSMPLEMRKLLYNYSVWEGEYGSEPDYDYISGVILNTNLAEIRLLLINEFGDLHEDVHLYTCKGDKIISFLNLIEYGTEANFTFSVDESGLMKTGSLLEGDHFRLKEMFQIKEDGIIVKLTL